MLAQEKYLLRLRCWPAGDAEQPHSVSDSLRGSTDPLSTSARIQQQFPLSDESELPHRSGSTLKPTYLWPTVNRAGPTKSNQQGQLVSISEARSIRWKYVSRRHTVSTKQRNGEKKRLHITSFCQESSISGEVERFLVFSDKTVGSHEQHWSCKWEKIRVSSTTKNTVQNQTGSTWTLKTRIKTSWTSFFPSRSLLLYHSEASVPTFSHLGGEKIVLDNDTSTNTHTQNGISVSSEIFKCIWHKYTKVFSHFTRMAENSGRNRQNQEVLEAQHCNRTTDFRKFRSVL